MPTPVAPSAVLVPASATEIIPAIITAVITRRRIILNPSQVDSPGTNGRVDARRRILLDKAPLVHQIGAIVHHQGRHAAGEENLKADCFPRARKAYSITINAPAPRTGSWSSRGWNVY